MLAIWTISTTFFACYTDHSFQFYDYTGMSGKENGFRLLLIYNIGGLLVGEKHVIWATANSFLKPTTVLFKFVPRTK